MKGQNLIEEMSITELEQRVEFSCCGGGGGGGGDGGEGPVLPDEDCDVVGDCSVQ